MKKSSFFILFLFLIFGFQVTWGQMKVLVSPKKATLGDTIRLMIDVEGEKNALPNLMALQKDFKILGTEQQINYSAVNGQSQSSLRWVIYLSPRRLGQLTIPSLSVGTSQSTPITIDISDGQAAKITQPEQGEVDTKPLEMKVMISPQKKVYVNQELLYTIKLYRRAPILDSQYEPPQVENGLLLPVGKIKTSQEEIHGESVEVSTQQYVVFPQKTGPLQLTPPQFTAIIYDSPPYRTTVTAPVPEIEVLPIPHGIKNWLPAKKVTISAEAERPDTTFYQGTTLKRTITVQAIGVPAQLLPRLEFPGGNGISVYPEKPIEENTLEKGEWVGRVTYLVTYLFNQHGQMMIPSLSLPWFNTQTHQLEKATLEGLSMTVLPLPNVRSSTVSKPKSTPLKIQSKTIGITQPSSNAKGFWRLQFANLGWIVAIFLSFPWLIRFIRLYYRREKTSFNLRQAKSNLKQACLSHQPLKAHQALLIWARQYWKEAEIHQFEDLFGLISSAELKKQLHFLVQAIYAKEKGVWNGQPLWQAVERLMKNKSKKQGHHSKLPPL